ncbi:glycosyltransferase family 4 protein [Boletus reticuloceps]|uniref:Alpha-1,3/1,6-mannosyltransferase ALG2 n=1 Tax=Boletus reticuloceps TaxID=495285 RepID=A0A8I2YN07_9AGAM|nr:glycosyltransferase family 4 protein [Boletus reticuloceps]
MTPPKLRIAFVHPDLGIGGAERLVVDAALGLQALGHTVDIYTSHHDPNHCFDETRDVFFVDQLSTCIPLLRVLTGKRLLFYCHFPDKLLAHGAFVEGALQKRNVGVLKALYRYPMDYLEEVTTRQADTLVANSKFTARIARAHLSSITSTPKVVYPGINIEAYQAPIDWAAPDVDQIDSEQPTLISLNRFEMKKNAALAIEAFALLRDKASTHHLTRNMRLVLAGRVRVPRSLECQLNRLTGGYDPRLEDNIRTLNGLVERSQSSKLSFNVITPPQSKIPAPSFTGTTEIDPDVLFLLNFTTMQRSALLRSSSTRALLYTPANEHFGIGPVEGMVCGLPVLACDSGGPTESIVDQPPEERTGWLRTPDPGVWADALEDICRMDASARALLAQRSKQRAESVFGMASMARELETLLVETVETGPVETWQIKGIAFVIAFLVGLVLAVWSRRFS